MSTYYSGKDCQNVLLNQTTWGTPTGGNVAGLMLSTAPVDIDNDYKLRQSGVLTGKRQVSGKDIRFDSYGSMPKLTTSDTAYAGILGRLFESIFQVSSTSGTQNTYTWHATQPDFPGNAGRFMTLYVKEPIANQTLRFKDCITQQLELKAEPGGEVQYTVTMLARGSGSAVSNYSGEIGRVGSGSIHHEAFTTHTVDCNDGAGAAAFVLMGAWSATIAQGVKGVDGDADGINFKSYMLGTEAPKQTTYKFVVLKDALAQKLKANRGNGKTVALNFGRGSGAVVGDMVIASTCKVTDFKENFGNDLTCEVELKSVLSNDFVGYSSTSADTIILNDGIA
jgi:hypothetical protein